jgi:prepilin signal peptidase PulO-like enzyme (type II secretory pathway)
VWLVFVFAFGACVGSLTNVLVYRLPLGLSVVTPPSRCPACETKLTWRENLPVFGWLFLRGRCRFCRSPISPEYPLVEAFVGLLFVLFFVLWYTLPERAVFLGVDWAAIRPEWARADALYDHWPRTSWPNFIALLVLVGSLVAMSLVDIKTYTIPLQIPWFATVAGLILHLGYAAYVDLTGARVLAENPFRWSIWTPKGWWWVGASFGAVIGLAFSNIALHFGWIRRSFADYAEWEASHHGATGSDQTDGAVPTGGLPPVPAAPVANDWPDWIRPFGRFALVFILIATGFTIVGDLIGRAQGSPRWAGLLAGVVVGPLIAALTLRSRLAVASADMPTPADPGTPADDWILYPHARREMLKEVVFLTPCIGLAWAGGWLATLLTGHPLTAAEVPLWLAVLTGVLMGYLIGGGVVWGARLFGSLAFGKEAMGLGDVHLMAAVGACVGWIDAALAFPLAAVVGLYWVLVHILATRQAPRAMQFGPYLAAATLLVILGKPLVEEGLTRLLAMQPGDRVNLP